MTRTHAIFLTVFVLLSLSCSRRPEGVIGDNEMVGLVADLEMAEGYMQTHPGGYSENDLRESLTQYILDKHGLTREEFDSTMTWYGRNPDVYSKLYAKVDKELEKKQKKLTGGIEQASYSDLWQYSRHMMISPNASTSNLFFNITPEEVKRGARLAWKMRFNAPASGHVMLGVTYDNGQSVYEYNTIGSNRNLEITLQTDTGKNVRAVFGNMIPDNLSGRVLLIDSITLKSLPFDSVEYYRINAQRRYSGPKLHEIKNTEPTDSSTTGTIKMSAM